MEPITSEQWTAIHQALSAPFPAEKVSWRVQKTKQTQSGKQGQVVAYVSAREVQDRLDSVVGPGNWAFDWVPVVTDAKGLLVAKGIITIHGVSKSDVGDASNFEGTKGTVSDAEKRAAVQWGIARYLYDLPEVWVDVTADGKLSEKTLKGLQASLARRYPIAA